MAHPNVTKIPPPTPVNAACLERWLDGYREDDKEFLVDGFKNGFRVGFEGTTNNTVPQNLKSALEMPELVTAHIQKELDAGRLAGPFSEPPFENFQCSPIGLVEKKEKGKYRMIHHLSFPDGSSVNDQIADEWSTVQYATICDAIDLVIGLCDKAFMSKTDVKHAFRVIPLHPEVRHLFVFQWQDSFYVDLALPMGCSSSCMIFEAVSTAVNWIAVEKLGIQTVHILDDFFLASVSCQVGTSQLGLFLNMCESLGLPMAPEKTFWPQNVMSFVGYEIDTLERQVRLPEDKLEKCLTEIQKMLGKPKATLREVQSLLGLLNFACAVILPGRPFLRRLFDWTIGVKEPWHHKRLEKDVKEDMLVWLHFLSAFNGKSIFPDRHITPAEKIQFFTDAAGETGSGYGGIFRTAWFNGKWSDWWLEQNITLLELYPIVVAVELWGPALRNKRILIRTDNQALVSVLTKQTSKEPLVMILVRRLVLFCLRFNLILSALHIPGIKNQIADALSRLQMKEFRDRAPWADKVATAIPCLPAQL